MKSTRGSGEEQGGGAVGRGNGRCEIKKIRALEELRVRVEVVVGGMDGLE